MINWLTSSEYLLWFSFLHVTSSVQIYLFLTSFNLSPLYQVIHLRSFYSPPVYLFTSGLFIQLQQVNSSLFTHPIYYFHPLIQPHSMYHSHFCNYGLFIQLQLFIQVQSIHLTPLCLSNYWLSNTSYSTIDSTC